MEHPFENEKKLQSRQLLEVFFIESLQELYFAENKIATSFDRIKDQIKSKKLEEILGTHTAIHLKHKIRLEKIFELRKEDRMEKPSESVIALISEAKKYFTLFSDDIVNWEIALILISQKLAHYKIAAYGAVAHLAINLNDYRAATLLAIDVQEEEEYIEKHLNGITHEFLRPYAENFNR